MQEHNLEPQADEARAETDKVDVETRLTAEQFVRAILKSDPNNPDGDTFWLYFPHAVEEVENREFWLKHLPELLNEFAEAFRDKSESELREHFAQVFEFSKKQAAEIGRVHVEAVGLREEIERLKRQVMNEQEAHEKIAFYLLPLVDTKDGATPSLAENAAALITELRAKLAEQERLLHAIVLMICDPKEAASGGELPTPAKAVEQIIDRVIAAEAELAALRERERWISVSERWPEQNEFVNVVIGGVVQMVPARLVEDHWYWYAQKDSSPKIAVTHWKALSAAPERSDVK